MRTSSPALLRLALIGLWAATSHDEVGNEEVGAGSSLEGSRVSATENVSSASVEELCSSGSDMLCTFMLNWVVVGSNECNVVRARSLSSGPRWPPACVPGDLTQTPSLGSAQRCRLSAN